jgi:hypothetical protein
MNRSEHRQHTTPANDQPPANTGRDPRGRFAKGNIGGPGNPFARKAAALRTALFEAVTDEDIRFIAAQLVAEARLGDLPAIKLLFQYVLGKPAAAVDPDTLDLHELGLYRQAPTPAEFQETSDERLPADAVADVLRVKLPCVGMELKDQVARAVLGIGPEDELEEEEPPCEKDESMTAPRSPERRPPTGAGGPRVEHGAAPSANGGVAVDPRPSMTPPFTNRPSDMTKPGVPPSGNGRNGEAGSAHGGAQGPRE